MHRMVQSPKASVLAQPVRSVRCGAHPSRMRQWLTATSPVLSHHSRGSFEKINAPFQGRCKPPALAGGLVTYFHHHMTDDEGLYHSAWCRHLEIRKRGGKLEEKF